MDKAGTSGHRANSMMASGFKATKRAMGYGRD